MSMPTRSRGRSLSWIAGDSDPEQCPGMACDRAYRYAARFQRAGAAGAGSLNALTRFLDDGRIRMTKRRETGATQRRTRPRQIRRLPVPIAVQNAPRPSTRQSRPACSMTSIRRLGLPTCSLDCPIIPCVASRNSCRGSGNRRSSRKPPKTVPARQMPPTHSPDAHKAHVLFALVMRTDAVRRIAKRFCAEPNAEMLTKFTETMTR